MREFAKQDYNLGQRQPDAEVFVQTDPLLPPPLPSQKQEVGVQPAPQTYAMAVQAAPQLLSIAVHTTPEDNIKFKQRLHKFCLLERERAAAAVAAVNDCKDVELDWTDDKKLRSRWHHKCCH